MTAIRTYRSSVGVLMLTGYQPPLTMLASSYCTSTNQLRKVDTWEGSVQAAADLRIPQCKASRGSIA
jgi:hypothetical protein